MQAASVLGVDTETCADPELVEKDLLAWQTQQMGTRRRPLSDARIAEERETIRAAIATDPRRGRLRWVQIAVPDVAVYLIDAFRVDARRLAPLFTAPQRPLAVMHYAPFDLQWFHYLGIDPPDGSRLFDTRGAAALLEASGDTGLPDTSLETVARRYLNVVLDKTEQSGDWWGELTEPQRRYAARDATVELELHAVLWPRLQAAGLERVWEIEMRCLPATVWCITTGTPIRKDAWLDQAARAELAREQAEAALNAHLEERGVTPERWHAEARRTNPKTGEPFIKGPLPAQPNWQSSSQVQAVFAALGHHVDGVNAEALAGLRDELLARLYTSYNQAAM
jgi:ribonuclease D